MIVFVQLVMEKVSWRMLREIYMYIVQLTQNLNRSVKCKYSNTRELALYCVEYIPLSITKCCKFTTTLKRHEYMTLQVEGCRHLLIKNAHAVLKVVCLPSEVAGRTLKYLLSILSLLKKQEK